MSTTFEEEFKVRNVVLQVEKVWYSWPNCTKVWESVLKLRHWYLRLKEKEKDPFK